MILQQHFWTPVVIQPRRNSDWICLSAICGWWGGYFEWKRALEMRWVDGWVSIFFLLFLAICVFGWRNCATSPNFTSCMPYASRRTNSETLNRTEPNRTEPNRIQNTWRIRIRSIQFSSVINHKSKEPTTFHARTTHGSWLMARERENDRYHITWQDTKIVSNHKLHTYSLSLSLSLNYMLRTIQ